MGLSLMPLSMVAPGETVDIVEVSAGRGLNRRLADMGLVPGTQVRIINSQGAGAMIVEVRGARLALGHGMAHRILVSKNGQEHNDRLGR